MFIQPLYVTEDKDAVATQVRSTGEFTDVLTNHPLSEFELQLLAKGRSIARRCAVIATAEEAEALPRMATENLDVYEGPIPLSV